MSTFWLLGLLLACVVAVASGVARWLRVPRWIVFGLPTAPMLIVFLVCLFTGAGAAGHGAVPYWPIFGVGVIIAAVVSALIAYL